MKLRDPLRLAAIAMLVFALPLPAFGATPSGAAIDPAHKFQRISGNSRFDVCVAAARQSFPEWAFVHDVVIASGDDKSAADPLAAASLCWAYDGPLLLVSGGSLPSSVFRALAEIKAANPGVQVHVVGGPASVPDARLAEIRRIVGKNAVERLPYGDRYATAAEIAQRVRWVAGETGRTVPSMALIANGADSTKFFDALALSAISARTGAPILLVKANSIPTATAKELVQIDPKTVYVAGGTQCVSDEVGQRLGARRLMGRTRYDTARQVANVAFMMGWLSPENIGIAAKLPDALSGGVYMGRADGPLLVNPPTSVSSSTGDTVYALREQLSRGYVFGGPASISESVRAKFNRLGDPEYVRP